MSSHNMFYNYSKNVIFNNIYTCISKYYKNVTVNIFKY